MTKPHLLVVLAGSDPHSALSQAEALLGHAAPGDRPILLQAQGIAHRNLRNPEESVARLRQSLAEIEPTEADHIWSIRADLAVSLGELGRPELGLDQLEGLEVIDQPDGETVVHPVITAKGWHARGLLLQRMGRPHEAMTCYQLALPRYEAAGEQLRIGQISTNLGLLSTYEGDIDKALAHIDRADAAFAEAGDRWWQAVSIANRGWILGCAGHLPKALQLMSDADSRLTELDMPDGLRVVSKAEVLLKGGLHGPARAELNRAIEHFDARQQGSDLSEALILAAQAAALDGDLEAARDLADRAVSELVEQNRPGWATAAQALRFGLQCRTGLAPTDLQATVDLLGDRLREAGHGGVIPSVILNAAWAFLDRDDPTSARRLLTGIDRSQLSTEDVVLFALDVARLHLGDGDQEAALTALDEGFSRLEADLGLLGGIDLAAVAADAVNRIVAEAKRILSATGDSARLLAWTDRGRQIATWRWPRLNDPELANLLNRARALGAGIDGAAPDDERVKQLQRVRQEIQDLRWQQETPAIDVHDRSPADFGRDEIGGQPSVLTSSSLIDITRIDDAWYAITQAPAAVAGGRPSIDHRPLAIDSARVSAIVRLARLLAVSTGPVRAQLLDRLDQLLSPINDVLVDHLSTAPTDVLFVGVDDELTELPWPVLPALWPQPFTILPTLRYLAERPDRLSSREGAAVVVGPGLASGGAETAGPGLRHVRRCRVTRFDHLAEALDHRVAHIAAHGASEPGNPLFNWLDFDFGRVFLHDLMYLDTVPETVVLAACYAGQSQRIGAGGSASFANGFLGVGSRWVVAASTALADDRDLTDFASAVLADIVEGDSPPRALARARTSRSGGRVNPAAIAFTCYGG